MKKVLKILCILVMIAVLVNCVCAPKAYAISELVVIGTIALTLAVAACITVTVAEANGTSEAFANAAAAGLQGQAEFTEFLLRSYSDTNMIPVPYLLAAFAEGAKITNDGKLVLEAELSNLLTDFFGWAWSAQGAGLVNYATPQDPMTIWYNDTGLYPDFGPISAVNTVAYRLDSNTIRTVVVDSPGVIIKTTYNSGIFGLGLEQFTYRVYDNGNLNTALSGTSSYITHSPQNYYQCTAGFGRPDQYPDLTTTPTKSGMTLSNVKSTLAYIMAHGTKDVIGGTPEYEDDALVLPAPGTGANVLDIPGAMTLPAPISGTATADEYLKGVAGAVVTGVGTIDYTDTEGIERTGAIEKTGAIDITQVAATSAEVTDSVDVAEGVGYPAIDNYSLDLRDYFPFCIPFDIAEMLDLLESAPEPINLDWTFDFPGIGQYTINLDFEEFNTVAQVLRTMELLSFCVGLAFATKRILMGS